MFPIKNLIERIPQIYVSH